MTEEPKRCSAEGTRQVEHVKLARLRQYFRDHAAIGISALALLLTVYTVLATHKQERLSALPEITFYRNLENGQFTGVYAENAGAGALAIKSYAPPNEASIKALASYNLPLQIGTIQTGFFMRPSEIFWVVRLPKGQIKAEDTKQFYADLLNVDAIFEYCSVYGECWKACSKPGDPRCREQDKVYYRVFNPTIWDNLF
ncbi:MAG: hypothetical protein ABSC95_17480 [Acetobacteraceae bacterium]|jgi:hypothetical protein